MPGETLYAPANWGFDAHLLPRGALPPALLHFSHDGHYLLATSQTDGAWHTRRLGRQGDGLASVAVADSAGRWHTVFKPNRFGDDPSPLTYLRINASNWEEDVREVVDPRMDARSPSIALARDGSVLLLYSRRDGEVMLARRTHEGWTRHSVLRDSSIVPIQNLTCDREGNCYFAYVNRVDRGLWLARGSGDSWTMERVWQYPADNDPPSPFTAYDLFTQIGPHGGPVVLVAHRCGPTAWLRVYQLAAF